MSIVTDAAAGATFAAWAGSAGVVTAGTGTVQTIGTVTTAPGLDGHQALRLSTGDLTVTGVPSFTDVDATVEAWVRLSPAATGRTVFARVNGGTEVSLTVGADGRPTVVVASTAGPYRVTLRGSTRVDDGRWHQLAVVIDRGWFSVVDVTLVVDGSPVSSGQMRPGLFGASPQLGMTSVVQIGARDGRSRLMGDLLVVAMHSRAVSASSLAWRWESRSAKGRATTGWGILLG
ncbi:LamG domain-containing protein [Corynebacterium hansenii]|uniref:LamG domain-containing protein n=1 Tax=Corynebacterium hansenii TaxID=394964 RepID=A0ABV7ZL89_9CORY|nr:LamG domain-containing protein [Corynebacterium hansenii]WJY99270.1 hypothetical protein CHAN_03210 [Corynebacterium hansenii]